MTLAPEREGTARIASLVTGLPIIKPIQNLP